MILLLVALLIAVPIAELWAIVQVAQTVGIPETIGLLILMSVAGAWLLRQQGVATWTRLQATLARGEVPAKEVVDGALILLGGALLLTPGFLTDAVGLILLIPPSRAVVKRVTRRAMGRRLRRHTAVRIYDARVVRSERTSASAAVLPPEADRGAGDDSPDRG